MENAEPWLTGADDLVVITIIMLRSQTHFHTAHCSQLTWARRSKRANSSFNIRTSSCADSVVERFVKPLTSAKRMLNKIWKCHINIQVSSPILTTPRKQRATSHINNSGTTHISLHLRKYRPDMQRRQTSLFPRHTPAHFVINKVPLITRFLFQTQPCLCIASFSNLSRRI